MGWTVLYIAFGLVALWLLGEVLLQNKARLRWRLLAFAGFLAVVVGVLIPSVIVIGVGLVAFAVGQTNVTLSFRRGFTTGWALRGKDGKPGMPGMSGKPAEGRRRRARNSGQAPAEPTLEVSGLEAVQPADTDGRGFRPGAGNGLEDTFESTGGFQSQDPYAGQGPYAGQSSYDYDTDDVFRRQDPYQAGQLDQSAYETQPFAVQNDYAQADATAVYAPQPMPDETGQYGIYSPDARAPQPEYTGYDAYGTPAGSVPDGGNGYAYDGSYGQNGAGQDTWADPYAAYGDALGQQTPYSDPYIGTQQYPAAYDAYGQPDPYAQSPYAQAPYAAQQYDSQGQPLGQNPGQGYGETPPGGVWVPQQRDSELPPEQQYPPYQQGYDGQQYRY
ncbi:hypothetical protein EST92_27330 [Streptomyces sp. TM32]|uniref:hypothetical protein n=1 Tax=Streptomyces sp. TM32 TaxID=1652669 RepID=UPI001012A9A2|nr:hypothetical protein [Streptomyces sp. TM32]RXS67871.1 hypothetical protein EST92_27330 [Streptomyces sp. TM32]